MKWAYYNEHDKKAAAWLRELMRRNLIAPGEVDERSIKEVTSDDLSGFAQCHFFAGIGVWSYALRLAGWPDEEPVWTGSCPCQPFSVSGKRAGASDERHLWPVWFPLIRESRPVIVLGEQVASDDGLAWLDLVCSDLEGQDYTIGAVDTCAAGFGAPHIRQRLYFCAHSSDPRCEGNGLQPLLGRGHESGASPFFSGPSATGDDSNANGRNASSEGLQRCGEQRLLAHDCGTGIGKVPILQGSSSVQVRPEPARFTDSVGTSSHSGDLRHADARGPQIGRAKGAGEVGGPFAQGSEAPNNRSATEESSRGTLDMRYSDDGGLAMHRGAPGSGGYPELTSETGGHLHTIEPGLEGLGGDEREWRGPGWLSPDAARSASEAGATRGFWADCDWWYGRDGKYRPIEPGIQPLAHGAAARVGRLRGYGNAIVAPQAAEFIKAVRKELLR